MENCRLLMRICSNVPMTCDVPMVYLMRLLSLEVPLLYIWGRTFKVYEVANGFLFCHTKLLFTIVISSLTPVRRPIKAEGLWREAFRGLYGYLPLMDIVCLKMMSMLTREQKIRLFGRYIAEKLVIGRYRKDFVNR